LAASSCGRGLLRSRVADHQWKTNFYSIGLPPAGKFHIDLDPTQLVFRNQSLKGTLVSSMAEVDETLDFAKRGMHLSLAV